MDNVINLMPIINNGNQKQEYQHHAEVLNADTCIMWRACFKSASERDAWVQKKIEDGCMRRIEWSQLGSYPYGKWVSHYDQNQQFIASSEWLDDYEISGRD